MKKSEKKKRYIIKYSPTFRQNLQDIFGFTEEQVREQEWETIKKQAKLREGLAKGFYYKATGNNRWDSESDIAKEPHYTNADAVLAFLTEMGAVLKVETKLPKNPIRITEHLGLSFDEALARQSEQDCLVLTIQDGMLLAGYTPTAPLVAKK